MTCTWLRVWDQGWWSYDAVKSGSVRNLAMAPITQDEPKCLSDRSLEFLAPRCGPHIENRVLWPLDIPLHISAAFGSLSQSLSLTSKSYQTNSGPKDAQGFSSLPPSRHRPQLLPQGPPVLFVGLAKVWCLPEQGSRLSVHTSSQPADKLASGSAGAWPLHPGAPS